MAKIKPNPLLIQSISGAIGELVYYRDADGNQVAQRKGERKKPASPDQLASNDRFRLASAYGNLVKADPELCAEYRPLCRGRMTPYHAALRDFMTPPKVLAIDLQSFTGQPGQIIC